MRTLAIAAISLAVLSCQREENAPTILNRVAETQIYPAAVFGTANRNDYPLADTIDDNVNTFMTTLTLNMNDTKTIIYQFQNPVNLAYFHVIDDYTNNYNLGDMTVLTSQDSTDGLDGSWYNVISVNAGNNGFIAGDGDIRVDQSAVRWLKLQMTYTGTGAYGGTPAFYLSEIRFYGN